MENEDSEGETTSAGLPEFIYAGLDTFTANDPVIRLLELLPPTGGADDDSIELRLQEHRLAKCPPYECLSYCWGPSTEMEEVICNGATLAITATLHSILLYLRPDADEPPRTLWIDQIAINQSDEAEKSLQVTVMRLIYEQAQQTVAWIGEASDDSDVAIDFLHHQNEYMVEHLSGDNIPEFSMTFADIWQDNLTSIPWVAQPTREQAVAVLRLVKRPWFSRIWIVQEAAVSKSIVTKCGAKEIDFDDLFMSLVLSLLVSRQMKLGRAEQLSNLITLASVRTWLDKNANGSEANEQLQLLSLLLQTKSFGATDARDKLFALFGVTGSDLSALNLRPDYQLSAEDIYTHTAYSLIRESRGLRVLEFPRSSIPQAGLPSWVPDWRDSKPQEVPFMDRWVEHQVFTKSSITKLTAEVLKRNGVELEDLETASNPDGADNLAQELENEHVFEDKETKFPVFRAAADSECTEAFLMADDRLRLSGHMVDRIQDVAALMKAPEMDAETMDAYGAKLEGLGVRDTMKEIYSTWVQEFSKFPKTCAAWEEFALRKQPSTYPTGESRERAYWKTLCAGYVEGSEKESEKLYRTWRAAFRGARWSSGMGSFRLDTGGLGTMVGLAATNLVKGGKVKTFASMALCTLHRRLARTAKGYFALVPGEAQAGDVIAVLKGGRVPFVLRSEGGPWKLIGTSYVHGIMMGEAFEESACANIYII